MNNAYTEYFNKSGVASNYHKKFTNRIDIARHKREVNILKNYCYGNMFDCTIATGRFINEFDKVVTYSGMDYSQDFVNYIKRNYPTVDVERGNLNESVNKNECMFDTVMCLRTLSALGNVKHVLEEMIRVTISGGHIIFDYGTSPSSSSVHGNQIKIDNENIKEILSALSAEITLIKTYDIDGFLIFLKRLSDKMLRTRIVHRLYKYIAIEKLPMPLLLWLDQSNFISATRKIYILKKR